MMETVERKETKPEKVGIITLYYNNDNYGGIAQAYALNEYISKLGMDSELISYRRSPVRPIGTKEKIQKDGMCHVLLEKLECLPQKIYYRNENRKAQKRYGEKLADKLIMRKKAFANSREKIRHSEVVTEDTIEEKLGNKYDWYVSGSDQIWKPGVLQNPYLFTFLDESKKRFSYASSITVTEFPEAYGDTMQNGLKNYKWISVREQSAKVYLEALLDRTVDVVVDPTLLLDQEDWNKVTAERQVDGKYLFAYFLGDNRIQRKRVQEFAKQNNLKIVTLPHVEGKVRASDIGFGDIELYDIDLAKFFSLIKYAEYVCTDSFHAVVFSNIFETNFYVFERIVFSKRHNMNSRIETLLTSFGEENCFVGKYNHLKKQSIDFSQVKNKAKPQIERSKELLKKTFNM